MSYQIEGLTLAITDMSKMLDFYTAVFGIDFTEQDMYSSRLYAGQWGDLKLLFCPAELAQNSAEQNRHQFDILVDDLDQILQVAKSHGGQMMSHVTEEGGFRSVGIYDPDRNSMVFKQKL
ncbi:MAG: VOC family protein [Roseivirga sp.]|nr:VOC family protein [Roseivirga sp.]